MKYLFTIFVLVALSSAVTLYYLWPSDPVSSQDVALRVNGHPMSRKQIDDQSREQGYHGETLEEQMDSLVTRQLLLQEAQRLGIDKEEGFATRIREWIEGTTGWWTTDELDRELGIFESSDKHYRAKTVRRLR
ncbi:MAG: SurA N-terminal domain-containing protein, partial [Proteobacteria bacterium]|nr:SurA N-terminal domain-containing protein [Pseudomonadota bacterium]